MNVVREIERINERELELNIAESASWHAQYAHSAYIFMAALDFALTEGDIICIASQFGEVVDCNLVRDKVTGASRGFAFVAYEDQRSAVLAIDNLNAAKLFNRTLRVDHADRYRRPKHSAAASEPDAEFKQFDDEEDDGYDERRKRIWDYSRYAALPLPAAPSVSRARQAAVSASSAPTSYSVDVARVGVENAADDANATRVLRLWEERKRRKAEREEEEKRKQMEGKDSRATAQRRAETFGDQLVEAGKGTELQGGRKEKEEVRKRRDSEAVNGGSEREGGRRKERRRERSRERDDEDEDRRRRRRVSSGSNSPHRSRHRRRYD